MSQATAVLVDQEGLLETLKAYKQGDFTARMRQRGRGTAAEIASTLNAIIEQNQILSKSSARKARFLSVPTSEASAARGPRRSNPSTH